MSSLSETTPLIAGQNALSGTTPYESSEGTKAQDVAQANIARAQKTQANKKEREYAPGEKAAGAILLIFVLLTFPISIPLLLIARYCLRKKSSNHKVPINDNATSTREVPKVNVVPPTRASLLSQDGKQVEVSTEGVYNEPLSDDREPLHNLLTLNSQTHTPAKREPRRRKVILNIGFNEDVQELMIPSKNRGRKAQGISGTGHRSIIGADAGVVDARVRTLRNQREEDKRDRAFDAPCVPNDEAELFLADPTDSASNSGSDVEEGLFRNVPPGDDARVYKAEAMRARAFGCVTVADALGYISSEEENSD
ncbi:MAG TPA: hypothetical protein VLG76_01970 [Rhabdochlamydiaceae bacterium]|nr:hypothetical protein [Rhabdochlamydiaceae bacterium]